MAIEDKFGRELITIIVNGEAIRPRDAVFVFLTPDGEVDGTLVSDHRTQDDIARAARSYWKSASEAIEKLNAGWRIELTTVKALLASATKKK